MASRKSRDNRRADRHGNAGYSMVELLVTVTILAIAAGIMAMSYTLVSRTNVKKAAGYVDDALSLCRTKSMASNGDYRVEITAGGVQVYRHIVGDDGETDESISESGLPGHVDVFVGQSMDAGLKKLGTDCSKISISYNMLSGDIRDVTTPEAAIKDDSSSCCYIVFRYKDKKECTIKLFYSTGKHSVSNM